MRPNRGKAEWIARDLEIETAVMQGLTYEAIGARYGITRQAVHQIACQLGLPSPRDVRAVQNDTLRTLEHRELRKRPCFLCAKPAQSLRKSRNGRVYCQRCTALVRNPNFRKACGVRVASVIFAARHGICSICRVKLRGPRAASGILCLQHKPWLRVAVHWARKIIRDYPEFDWARIIDRASRCTQCGKRAATPGMSECYLCRRRK